MISPTWFGASGASGLYTQVRVLQYRAGLNYPLKFQANDGDFHSSFWTDRPLTRIAPGNVYFFSPSLRGFKSNYVKGSFVAWIDLDTMDLPDYHCQPSLIVVTGHGRHVYWRFTSLCGVESLAFILKGLQSLYHSDPAVCDVTRFMRFPGSYNHKFSPPFLTYVEDKNDKIVYDVLDFGKEVSYGSTVAL